MTISEDHDGAAAQIWTEFVHLCEEIESTAEAELSFAGSSYEEGFLKGQRFAAKSIRRAVAHPKYRTDLVVGELTEEEKP